MESHRRFTALDAHPEFMDLSTDLARHGDESLGLELDRELHVDEEAAWGPRPRLMASEPGGRRTVVITGRAADRHLVPRSRQTGHGSAVLDLRRFAADRTAMWAVLLCVIVLLVALTSH